jgi:hypothetical protein
MTKINQNHLALLKNIQFNLSSLVSPLDTACHALHEQTLSC